MQQRACKSRTTVEPISPKITKLIFRRPMSSYKYYDDLSGSESNEDSDCSSTCSNHNSHQHLKFSSQKKRNFSDMHELDEQLQPVNDLDSLRDNDIFSSNNRIILHLDIDCFYCQCECIDRKLDPDRPLAIGQKHIIVTCNYAARRQLGLTKLMNRKKAIRDHPSLLIVDGSDLEQYRRHGRTIYECFRKTIKSKNQNCSVCKGSMDEMMADLTPILQHTDDDGFHYDNNSDTMKDIYIYGEQNETTIVTEDQSGASSTIVYNRNKRKNIDSSNSKEIQQLKNVSKFAIQLRQTILDETGFTTTIGLSVNPLLAKLASGLRKPWKVNILPSMHAHVLIEEMPVRKIPGIGYGTNKALKPCLESYFGNNSSNPTAEPVVWTCG
jgi:DNA polymerase iota